MTRMICMLGALAISALTLSSAASSTGSAAFQQRTMARPIIVGADDPVFLGSMVVTASALPSR